MAENTVLTFCQHCHMKCRISCELSNGRLVKITNLMGVDCPKGIYTMELLYHPDRLTYPLKRIGAKGEGKWQRISWDEALDIMADRLGNIKAKFGAEAIADVRGCGHKHMARFATLLFSHVIGTPNTLDINLTCNVPSTMMAKVTIGDANITWDTAPEFRKSNCILLWGSNTRHTRPPHENEINRAQASGARLIVVDPRPPERRDMKNQGVSPADIWLRLRPGTDAALALGMLNVVISEGFYKKDFVRKWCVGFEELKERVQQYSPAKVAEITWVPAENIIKAARMFATTSPACLHLRLGGGGGMDINASQSSRAIAILLAVAGDIDVPGGNLLENDLGGFREVASLSELPQLPLPPGMEEKRLGAKEFPLIAGSGKSVPVFSPRRVAHTPTCIRAMLNGDIKALFVPGSNLMGSFADMDATRQALNRIDFLTVVDLFMTPTAELADLVLPAAHFLETEVPFRAFQSVGPNYHNYILAPRKVIEPIGECWDDRKIVLELARKMGVKTPWNGIDDLNNWQLEKVGVSYRDLQKMPGQMLGFPIRYRKYETEGFKTPSGKIELRSSILEKIGQDALPHYTEPPQSPLSAPELFKEYPLVLTEHRNIAYIHSEFRQLPTIRRLVPDQEFEMSPETAAGLGINVGDEVYIERPGVSRRVRGRAKIVPGMDPRVVACLSLWWLPERPAPEHGCFEVNTNAILSAGPPYDPINGNYQVRGFLCRLGKV